MLQEENSCAAGRKLMRCRQKAHVLQADVLSDAQPLIDLMLCLALEFLFLIRAE